MRVRAGVIVKTSMVLFIFMVLFTDSGPSPPTYLRLQRNGHADFDSDSLEILEKIYQANREQKINNLDQFGPITEETVVIVVQVHKRRNYLSHLIQSLSLSAGIEKTLLIFSHDVWEEEINDLVRSISFARTTQIFFPLSLQTHRTVFPGQASGDCPRDLSRAKAKTLSCTNAAWPDRFGHYREAEFSQTKHHWWWKANTVFSGLPVTRNHTGLVLFLEEDHFLGPDFLHLLSLMTRHKQELEVDILSLGTYLGRTVTSSREAVEVMDWISSKHNMGMALTRVEWEKILSCSGEFCQFDDYNWDWSLQHVSDHCLREPLTVLVIKQPRVFHIGECGLHHKKTNCDPKAALDRVRSIIQSSKENLFPESLQLLRGRVRRRRVRHRPNGGWGDKRDHQLCLNFTTSDLGTYSGAQLE